MYQVISNYRANTGIFEYLKSCTGFLENTNIKGDNNMAKFYAVINGVCVLLNNSDKSEFSVDSVKRIINNNPYTVILWKDGTKTIVKCQEGDTYSLETGIAMCFMKKMCGNNGSFNEVFRKYCENVKD